ncbi:hypothetical protein [Rhodococcus erythropolis]|uniref:hypothetical protein n=1 Tax=Rhodococcus erythropolis TaxID=1833 RepID=UPI00222670B0|nr:hypothetical protein [Rhodococcus erythropolis]MCW2295463.1 hypothetical protein [Rhodococcus erythropolis]
MSECDYGRDGHMMFCSISARSELRPNSYDYDPRHILDFFSDQVATQRALTLQMPTDQGAREAARDYLRRIGASGGSPVLDIPAEVHRAFRTETGMTFADGATRPACVSHETCS